jgi:hypothetical protein
MPPLFEAALLVKFEAVLLVKPSVRPAQPWPLRRPRTLVISTRDSRPAAERGRLIGRHLVRSATACPPIRPRRLSRGHGDIPDVNLSVTAGQVDALSSHD